MRARYGHIVSPGVDKIRRAGAEEAGVQKISTKLWLECLLLANGYPLNVHGDVSFLTGSHGLVNSAMGQIPCSTKRISCCYLR